MDLPYFITKNMKEFNVRYVKVQLYHSHNPATLKL